MNRIMLVLKTSKQAVMIKRRMRVNLVDNSRIWRDGFTVCINNDDDLMVFLRNILVEKLIWAIEGVNMNVGGI